MTFCAGIWKDSTFPFVENHGVWVFPCFRLKTLAAGTGQYLHVRALWAILSSIFQHDVLFFGGKATNGKKMECDDSKAVR